MTSTVTIDFESHLDDEAQLLCRIKLSDLKSGASNAKLTIYRAVRVKDKRPVNHQSCPT